MEAAAKVVAAVVVIICNYIFSKLFVFRRKPVGEGVKIRHKMSFAYFTVVFGILMAKAAGFIRDIIFAKAFGTTAESDIYFQIYGVVNLVFTFASALRFQRLSLKTLTKKKMPQKKKGALMSPLFCRGQRCGSSL